MPKQRSDSWYITRVHSIMWFNYYWIKLDVYLKLDDLIRCLYYILMKSIMQSVIQSIHNKSLSFNLYINS